MADTTPTQPQTQTQIINLDDVVPRTMVFQLHGDEWMLPGDIDVETTFKFQQLLLDLGEAEEAELTARIEMFGEDSAVKNGAGARHRAALDQQRKVTLEMEREVLDLFKVAHPDMTQLPFGAAAFRAVLATILVRLGFGGEDEEEVASEDPTPPKPRPKMVPPKSKRSRTSSASRKSSASTPTTGSEAVA